MMIDKLKSPKVRAALVTMAVAVFLVVWTSVTGSAPPAPVLDAIEEHADVGIDCDDAGNCSVVVSEGSADTPPGELLPHSEAASELEGVAAGSGEGSGE
jgi:hypothetical protein